MKKRWQKLRGESMLFSIIIPVYNVREYLDDCIQSIVNQSLKDFEVILVDDGSTDGSEVKCDEWKSKCEHVRVIHQENSGAAKARNVGIKTAQGDYIVFLDGDDYWPDSNGLLKLQRIVAESGDAVDMVLFPFCKKNLNTGKIQRYCIDPGEKNCGIADAKRELLRRRQYTNSPCTKLIRKNFLIENEITFPEGRKTEDLVFCRKLLTFMQRFEICEDPLLIYQVNRAGSTTTGFGDKHYRDTLDHFISDLRNLSIADEVTQQIGKAYWAEQACWFLAFLPRLNIPLKYAIAECTSVFEVLQYGMCTRTKMVRIMIKLVGKTNTVKLLNLYLSMIAKR